MAEFQFRGIAKGQNATDIIIDNVNDLAMARTLAEARYPGYKLTNGMKLGVITPAPPNTPSTPPNELGGIKTPTHESVSHAVRPASGNDSIEWFVLSVTFDCTIMVIKFLCKTTWKVMKFTYNRGIKPAYQYTRSHWSF